MLIRRHGLTATVLGSRLGDVSGDLRVMLVPRGASLRLDFSLAGHVSTLYANPSDQVDWYW